MGDPGAPSIGAGTESEVETDVEAETNVETATGAGGRPTWRAPDGTRLLQLALAGLWLLDGVLQLQPSMFMPGGAGLGGVLAAAAAGNPHVVATSITWNASIVGHHAVAADTGVALIQILIALGIAWRPTVRVALGASVVWALVVWWFGEGLGGVLHGAGTPVDGGPGAVLFYALLAILLWPGEGAGPGPFVAARTVGLVAARVIWMVVWLGLAVLALTGSGRSPEGIHNEVQSLARGQPGWLAAVDRHVASLLAAHGLAVALAVAAIFVAVALGVLLPVRAARVTLVVALAAALAIWFVGENFGMILAGEATDPSSGPAIVLLALAYWPRRPAPRVRSGIDSVAALAEVA